jgi:hypothetical protein
MLEEVDRQRERSRSAVSSNNHPTKREREEDEEMEMMSSDNKEESLPDPSLPTSAIDNTSDVRDASVHIDSVGDGDIAVDDEIGIEFKYSEVNPGTFAGVGN